MIRKALLICLLFASIVASMAQSPADTRAILEAPWQRTELGQGLVWKRYLFADKQLYNANQSINYVETRLRNRQVRWALVSADQPGEAKRRLLPTSQLAREAGALVGLNGTFFDTKQAGSVDMMKINGYVLDTTRVKPTDRRAEHQQAAITIEGRKISIVKGDEQGNWDRALRAPNVMVTGPLLLWKGQVNPLKKSAFNDNRHPRTCLCITQDKRLILLTADGRAPQAQGLSLTELTHLMQTLGCHDAINLDGGGSTTLWIQNQPDGGVVNYPCDNKQFDHFGERPVSNALIIKRK